MEEDCSEVLVCSKVFILFREVVQTKKNILLMKELGVWWMGERKFDIQHSKF